MVKRQPGRPSEYEFIEAASRFVSDDYEIDQLHVVNGFIGTMYHVPIGKALDELVIRSELRAEGVPGEREPIRDFALKQLAIYQKLRKD